jgi:hypothetical protein
MISGATDAIISAIENGLSGPLGGVTSFNKNIGLSPSLPITAQSIASGLSAIQANYMASGSLGLEGLGNHVLFNALRRQDPLLNYSWFCTMPLINGVSLPWYYVEEFVAPFRSFDVQSRYQQGKLFHYAGQQSLSNVTVKIYDDTTGTAGAYLEAWRNAVCSVDGTYSYPVNYKKNIVVTVLDITRLIQVYTITYKGCWPTTTDPMNLGSSSSDRIIQGQEFSVDNISITVRNYSAPEMAGVIYSSLDTFPQGFVDQLSSAAGGTFTAGVTNQGGMNLGGNNSSAPSIFLGKAAN